MCNTQKFFATFELSHVNVTFLPLYYLSIYLNQFSHPEGGGSVLFQDIRKFDQYTLQNLDFVCNLMCNCHENLKA